MSNPHATAPARSAATATGCLRAGTEPVVLDAVEHPVMRRWSAELLGLERGCWRVEERGANELVADAVQRTRPDVVVVDDVEFPACCELALAALDPDQVIVVGPEPDTAYRSAALARGANGWVSRDRLGDDLADAVRRALGCPFETCPHPRTATAAVGATASRTPGGASS